MNDRIAAFDVDGTLTTRDCVVPFLRRVAPTHRLVTGMLRRPVTLAASAARRDRDALKAASVAAAFTGRSRASVESEAAAFGDQVHARWLRPDVVELLRGHVRDGDTVLLVSASFEVYLRPLGDLLGVDDVLAARLEIGADDRYTGRLLGANCRGPEKVRRLHEWLEEHAGGRDRVHLTAYGDSIGDRELLADADVARWLGRGEMPFG